MNSDNTLVGGRTMDYGPFGVLEQTDPLYQPFTSDREGKFAFMNQPQAMAVNVAVLGECLADFLRWQLQLSSKAAVAAAEDMGNLTQNSPLTQLARVAKHEFPIFARRALAQTAAGKLGLRYQGRPVTAPVDDLDEATSGIDRDVASSLFDEAIRLMTASAADWTIFWRLLGPALELDSSSSSSSSSSGLGKYVDDVSALLDSLEPAFYTGSDGTHAPGVLDEAKWGAWLEKYLVALGNESEAVGPFAHDANSRLECMRRSNPKYVLRNWMNVLAYEAAQTGDTSVAEELLQLLEQPYDEQPEREVRWFQKSPVSHLIVELVIVAPPVVVLSCIRTCIHLS
jgi:uncharacterized protein YdiU (UPF0061 family)